MRVLFMGTPHFAVDSLHALITSHDVIGVVTQTDKPSGRGKKMTPPPIKVAALNADIPVYQFERINTDEAKAIIMDLAPDIIVVVAYGQILKEWLLTLPKFGCINVHASLLPRWRGASPIQTAIVHGDRLTGITIMKMDKGLDTGDMLRKVEVEITPQMTFETLHDILKVEGAKALVSTLEDIVLEKVKPEVQDETLATYAPLITKEMSRIVWSQSARAIVDLIRGYNPFPVAFTTLDDKRIKVYSARVVNEDTQGEIGRVVKVDKKHIYVQTGKGIIALEEIQAMGSKRMLVSAYLLGHSVNCNQTFGL